MTLLQHANTHLADDEAAHRRWSQTADGARRYILASHARGTGAHRPDKWQRATQYQDSPELAAAKAAAIARLHAGSEEGSKADAHPTKMDPAETATSTGSVQAVGPQPEELIMTNSLLELKLDLIARQLNAYVIEDVATVMRRQFTREDGVEVDVVDFYPPWNKDGTFGKHKVAHEYMDEDWQRERFERYAGYSVDTLPVYEAGQALKRNIARPHRCEVNIRPFRLMLRPRQDADGNDLKTLIIRYLTSPKAKDWVRPATIGEPVKSRAKTQPPAPEPPTANSTSASVDHLNLAIEATVETAFDYHVYMHFHNGVVREVKNITWLRRQISERWAPDGATANGRMIAAIDKYLKERQNAAAAGQPATQHHRLAIGPARREYQLKEAQA